MSDQTAATPEDPNELVTLQHDGIEGTIVRKRRALKHMAPGWKIVDAEAAAAAVGDEGPAGVYAEQDKKTLEDLVAQRNADRGPDDQVVVKGRGTQADLAAALTADDITHPQES